MTPEDRKALAQQLVTNPLLELILDEIEHEAVERCVSAPPADDQTRRVSAMEVQALRSFKWKLEQSLQDSPPLKGAPA